MLKESGALSLATRTEGTDEDFADMLKIFELACARYISHRKDQLM